MRLAGKCISVWDDDRGTRHSLNKNQQGHTCRPKRFIFTYDKFRCHYATKTPINLVQTSLVNAEGPVPLPLKNGKGFYNALALHSYRILRRKHCERLATFYMVVVLDSQH